MWWATGWSISRVEYIFYCDVEFYVRMFGHSYPTITQRVELTGYHNTKF